MKTSNFLNPIFGLILLCCSPYISANNKANSNEKFDYSTVSVAEETGTKFEKITDDGDYVYANDSWLNPLIAISPDGSKLAFINDKNKSQNIMVKNALQGGVSIQRTYRVNVKDVSWSPDGKTLCFTEYRNKHYGLYMTNASQGSVVRQISNGIDNDYGGVFTSDCKQLFFHRGESNGSYSLWSYDFNTNLFSNYTSGVTACLSEKDPNIIYCTRFNSEGNGEVWRLNIETGVEETILAVPGKNFITPRLSPDGNWILLTGNSISEKEKLKNKDIFVVRTDGTQLTQLTFHPANDFSAVWGADGMSIYFLSQRGSSARIYNVWKMSFYL